MTEDLKAERFLEAEIGKLVKKVQQPLINAKLY